MHVLSFSQIQAYWACPRLHYYRYFLRVPSPQSDTQQAREGSWIHEQLHLDYLGQHSELAHQPEWSQIWAAYQHEISAYTHAGSWSEWTCHVPLASASGRVWLTGRLDRVYLHNQVLTILDWKTGHAGPGESTALQLDFYIWLAWMARTLLAEQAIERIRARAVWLDLPGTVLEKEVSSAEISALSVYFKNLLQPLQAEETVSLADPRSVNGHPWCTMCEYQPLCPEGKYHA